MRTYTIYSLLAKDSDTVMYVGVTCGRLNSRLSKHRTEALRRRNTSPCAQWIRRLHAVGQTITIHAIEVCHESEWQEKERHWIRFFRLVNPGLLNIKPGGITSKSDDNRMNIVY